MSLIDCLNRIGLSEHESAILMGEANLAMRNGAEENEAALQAIDDYRAGLDNEMSSVIEQVQGQQTALAPFGPDVSLKTKSIQRAKEMGFDTDTVYVHDPGHRFPNQNKRALKKILSGEDNTYYDGLFSIPQEYYDGIDLDGKNNFFVKKALHHGGFNDEFYKNNKKTEDLLIEEMGGYKDLSDDQKDIIKEYITEERKDIHDLTDEYIALPDWITELFSEDDAGMIGWTLQKIRGHLALEFGYDAVDMYDETGTSVLLLPTTGVKNINASFELNPSDPYALHQSNIQSEVFYSQLESVTKGAVQKKATPEQWTALFNKNGVKRDELEWIDIEGFFKGRKAVTKEELLTYLAANQVQVTEVEKGQLSEEAETQTKFEKQQLPGGENYKELLLTLPEKVERENWQEAMNDISMKGYKYKAYAYLTSTEKEKFHDIFGNEDSFKRRSQHRAADSFRSGHYAEPNILAHIRFNERTDTDGKRVLFIEEIQSDWHQSGRKRGYKPTDQQVRQMYKEALLTEGMAEEEANIRVENAEVESLHYNFDGLTITKGPFKKSWPLLAMKRMIRYASDNGFDSVAWTTGEQQSNRYNLSKKIDRISYLDNEDGTYNVIAFGKEGERIVDNPQMPLSEVENILGKDIAEEMSHGDGALEDDLGVTTLTLRGDDLKVGSKGLKIFYDSMLPNIVNKYVKNKKWGAKVGKTEIKTNEINVPVHSLTITPQMKEAALSGQALFQESEEKERGQIVFGDETVIRLFKNSDTSTFLHESAHMFLEMEGRFAEKFGVSDNQKELLKWLGVESFSDIDIDTPEGVKIHEKFARGFEAYLREGKAPSIKLHGAFAAFADWLKKLYKSVSLLDVQIDDNIRQVFDRMLATEEEIALAQNNPAHDQFFRNKEQLGMSDIEWEKYEADMKKRKEVTRNAAEQTINQKLLKELYHRKSKKWDDEKKPIFLEEKERLEKERVYETEDNLKTDPIDRAEVKEVLGIKKLPYRLRFGRTVKDGKNIDMYAEEHGYISGEEMLNDIIKSPTLETAAETAAQARMIEKYGDILNDGSIEDEAKEAVHNDEEAKLLLDQLNMMNRKDRKKTLNREQLKNRVKDTISSLKHSEIKPGRYYRNEIRAAENAAKATTPEERLEFRTQQVLNHYLYKEAIKAREDIDKYGNYIDGVNKRDYSPRGVDKDFIQTMKMIAKMYGMQKSPEKKDTLFKVLNWFRAQTIVDQKEKAINHNIINVQLFDPNLIKALEAMLDQELNMDTIYDFELPDRKDLTVEELRGVYEMLRHLRYVGGKMADLDKAEFLDERDNAINSILENSDEDVIDPAEPQKWDDWVNSGVELLWGTVHTRNMARVLDGMKEDGWFYRNVYIPVIDSADNRIALQRRMAKLYKEQFKDLNDLSIGKSDKKSIIRENGNKYTLSSEGRVMLAMYWGSLYSRDALMRGNKLTQTDVEKMLAYMTEDELELVNRLWKLNEVLWPESSAQAIRLYGVAPEKVEAAPFIVNGVEMTGGYTRIYYASSIKELDANEEATHQTALLSYSKQGAMHERIGSGGKKLLLDKSNIIRALNENIHSLAYADNFKKIASFLNNKKLKEVIIQKYGHNFYDALTRKIESDMGAKRDVELERIWSKIARLLRISATYKHLGFSPKNTMQQFSAVPIAGQEVGRGKLLLQYTNFANNPLAYMEKINKMSSFMDNRAPSINREAADQLGKISEDSALKTFKEFAFIMQTTIDALNAYPTWMTQYENVMGRESKEALTKEDIEEAHKKAIIDANLAVKESIGSGMDVDLGRLLSPKRNETTRMMTMFNSWFNAYANRVFRDSRRFARRKHIKNEIEFQDKNLTREMLQTVTLTPLITMMLTSLLVMDGPEDDENWIWWGAKQYGTFMLSILPYVREITSSYNNFSQKTPVGILFGAVTDVPKSFLSNWSELDLGAVAYDTSKAVTTIFTAPGSGLIFKVVDYWDSYEQGDEGDFNIYQAVTKGKTRSR